MKNNIFGYYNGLHAFNSYVWEKRSWKKEFIMYASLIDVVVKPECPVT